MAKGPQPLVPMDPNSVSQAGVDLGMGSDLQQQAMQQIMDRRKRALLAVNQAPSAFGALGNFVDSINAWTAKGGPLSSTGTGNTGGTALQALMGTGVMGG